MKNVRRLLLGSFFLAFLVPAHADDSGLIVTDWPGFDIEGLYAAYKEKWGDRPTYSFVTSDDDTF